MSQDVEQQELATNNESSIRATKATECREKISHALQGASVAYYDMAMGLLEAYENEYAKEWGFENFSDYVERELDMKFRTAYYMVNTAKTIRSLGISAERIARIPWTKMREISAVLSENKENAEKYLKMAETLSRSQLIEEIKSEIKKTKGTDAKEAVMRLSLVFKGEEASMVSDALNVAYADIGKEDINIGLVHIVGEWLMAHQGSVQSSTLESWVDHIEKAFGVKLVVAEGEDNLDTILADNLSQDDIIDVTPEEDDALDELLR